MSKKSKYEVEIVVKKNGKAIHSVIIVDASQTTDLHHLYEPHPTDAFWLGIEPKMVKTYGDIHIAGVVKTWNHTLEV